MPAYRCGSCGINFPAYAELTVCPICRDRNEYHLALSPDPGWPELISAARAAEQAVEEDPILDLGDASSVWVDNDRLFVTSADVHAAGIGLRLPDGTILRVTTSAGTPLYFEVQGWHESERRYWIRYFEMSPDTFPEEWTLDD